MYAPHDKAWKLVSREKSLIWEPYLLILEVCRRIIIITINITVIIIAIIIVIFTVIIIIID